MSINASMSVLTDSFACMGQSEKWEQQSCCFPCYTTNSLKWGFINLSKCGKQIKLLVCTKGSEVLYFVGKMESSSMNNTVEKDVDLLVDTAEAEVLKKRISSHPLYGLLVQTHIDCLKVGTIGGVDQIPRARPKLPCQFPNPSPLSQPELDSFMEAYCFALSKLKEAMEEPQQETAAFIDSMHLQLKELTRTHSKSASELPTSTASSGKRIE